MLNRPKNGQFARFLANYSIAHRMFNSKRVWLSREFYRRCGVTRSGVITCLVCMTPNYTLTTTSNDGSFSLLFACSFVNQWMISTVHKKKACLLLTIAYKKACLFIIHPAWSCTVCSWFYESLSRYRRYPTYHMTIPIYTIYNIIYILYILYSYTIQSMTYIVYGVCIV